MLIKCMNLSECVILYGWHQNRDSNYWLALNYSLIFATYHIFATSIRVGILDFESFLLRLKNKMSTLRAIAIKNSQLDIFNETVGFL